MTWQSVGQHTFLPTDRAVQIGSFDLAPGQDTIWVRITQLNQPAEWPWSYGILSWRSSFGLELGSIKAYSTQLGEVFRLGVGLPPSDGTGSIWFEPRGFNLGWLKAGFPWELSFEAQAGSDEVNFNPYWGRANSTLSPATAGDSVAIGSDSNIKLNANGSASFSGDVLIADSSPFGRWQYTAAGGAGVIRFTAYNGSGTQTISMATDGSAAKVGGGSWAPTSSARRLKDIVGDVDKDQAWELLKKLDLKRYYYKSEDPADRSPVPWMGLIAEDAAALDPELKIVTDQTDDQGEIWTYNMSVLQQKAWAALSAALIRIEALETALAESLNLTSQKE